MEKGTVVQQSLLKSSLWHRIKRDYLRNWMLYLFILPSFVYVVVLCYFPIYGVQIAFRDYRPARGILGSTWVGFKHFERFLGSYNAKTIIKNTLIISFYQLLTFPVPIALALIINYTPLPRLRKFTQSVTYAPHFISTVVLCGMIMSFFSQQGVINQIGSKLFGTKMIDFMSYPEYWRSLFVGSGIWQNAGYRAVIYIAALAGVSYELHEAAIIDGANRLQRIWNIDIPSILPTIVILLIMQCGSIMNVGFQKAYLLQNSLNLEVSEVISTYVYKQGLQKAQYSLSSAVGLFNNVINFLLVITVNRIAKKVTGSGMW